MSFTQHSDLDTMNGVSVDDFIKSFDLNYNLSAALKYLVRYSQHKNTKAGRKNLDKALERIKMEISRVANIPIK